jgi:RNA polymerase-binding protein DksA
MNKKMTETTKVKLLAEIQNIKQHMINLNNDDPLNDPGHASDNAAVDLDVREQDTHQRLEAEINSLQERLINIDQALKRIEKGNYGTCKRCNKEIPVKRLALIPETVYCVSCEAHLKK